MHTPTAVLPIRPMQTPNASASMPRLVIGRYRVVGKPLPAVGAVLLLLAGCVIPATRQSRVPVPSAVTDAAPLPPGDAAMERAIGDLLQMPNQSSHGADNSAVYLAGPAMDRAAAIGLPIVPVALKRMESDTLSFDGFVRLYALCSRVLQAHCGTPVWWSGGVRWYLDADGVQRYTPGYQLSEDPDSPEGRAEMKEFKQRVMDDVRRKYQAALVAWAGNGVQYDLVRVLSDPPGPGGGIDNGRVVVCGPAYDQLMRHGISVIPSTVSRMMEPDLDFDGFVRLYSLCDQILVAHDQPYAFWTGGAGVEVTAAGRYRFAPTQWSWDGENQDTLQFRQRVVTDIVGKYMAARAKRATVRP